ncbi:MAG: HD domain-containing phosphohydrolase [Acidobacteriota bacterium]
MEGEETANANILIVDDSRDNLRILARLLRRAGYDPRPVSSGEVALEAATVDPPDLVLLDIRMPGMDGYEVCRRLKQDRRTRDIPVLFLSADVDTDAKLDAFRCGGVDYIPKPFRIEEVRARIDTHLTLQSLRQGLEEHNTRLHERVQDQVKEIAASQSATIFALAKLAECRDDDTGRHVERVQIFSRRLAERLQDIPAYADTVDKGFVENVFMASALHDIGKVGIRDSVLLKPGPLTGDEFEEIKTHPTMGRTTLEAVLLRFPHNTFLQTGVEIAGSHHERWDGGGYPEGLAGTDIPLSARIVAVADVYDAWTSNRVYRPAITHEEVRSKIGQGKGTHFDPHVADAFALLEDDFRRLRQDLRQ